MDVVRVKRLLTRARNSDPDSKGLDAARLLAIEAALVSRNIEPETYPNKFEDYELFYTRDVDRLYNKIRAKLNYMRVCQLNESLAKD